MEYKQSPSRKLLSIQEEKLIREVDYDSFTCGSKTLSKKKVLLDLEIFQKKSTHRPASQRVLVSITPRTPAIQTIYIAEKTRFHSRKASNKSGLRLAIEDHSSFSTDDSENEIHVVNSVACGTDNPISDSYDTERNSSVSNQEGSSEFVSKCSEFECEPVKVNVYNNKKRSAEKCYIYTQPQLQINLPKFEASIDKQSLNPNKVDIATLIITNSSSEETSDKPSVTTLSDLYKRIGYLERKILKQEMFIRSIDSKAALTSTDGECNRNANVTKTSSSTDRPGCSYIQQYSHIPEMSAFQRYTQQPAPLSSSKATTLDKEHNSEQYGRDFTTYDGLTARGRRQCASVPCKRDDIPKLAAERVHKIRNKLNPVRDYRLMDTVHYLAQGEFAPRDDGIKLTPSREAVLSDIIWEDVCRTHWPNTRLGRRGVPHSERCTTRCELQRLIDSLLRERVTHVERRRRRHYRIVKLNHRHESCRPVGKTGDVIVASHKNNQNDEITMSEHNAVSALRSDRRWVDTSKHKRPRSRDRVMSEMQQNLNSLDDRQLQDNSRQGPSYISGRSPAKRDVQPTCCYQTTSLAKPLKLVRPNKQQPELRKDFSSSSSVYKPKNPRLVIKKDASRKYNTRDEPDLEHYILLPTLVVRTPSNMKRQKKFNELYHRILNVKLNNVDRSETDDPNGTPNLRDSAPSTDLPSKQDLFNKKDAPIKKDIGLNFNITLSSTSEHN